jgi:phospholipid/cholesterol/gamma-HCH transport system substrate-binding protein
VVGGLLALAALVALAMFAGGSPYTLTASFENAGQLVKGNQVQVGGRAIGTISEIELADTGEAEVTMELEDELRVPGPRPRRRP